MPLFVPIAIIGASFVAGAVGLKKGKDGYDARQRAEALASHAKARHERHANLTESARAHVAERIAALDARRLEVQQTTLKRMVEILETLQRRGQVRAVLVDGELVVEVSSEPSLPDIGSAVTPGLGAYKVGQFVGAAAGAATGHLVGAFGTASTGTAISTLSGAAAKSATLAWLGGGSLAAGGGGMKLGALVLGGIKLGPALLVGGYLYGAAGDAALERARQYQLEVERSVTSLGAAIALLHGIERRVGELRTLIDDLDARAAAEQARLAVRATSPAALTDAEVRALARTMLLCKALSELIQVRVLRETGDLDDAAAELMARVRADVLGAAA